MKEKSPDGWKFREWWEENYLLIEALIPLLLTLGVIICAQIKSGKEAITDLVTCHLADTYAAISQIAASLLGFVVAAVAIVIGYLRAERFKLLRNSKAMKVLWKTFFQATYFLAALTVSSLVGLLSQRGNNVNWLWFHLTVLFLLLSAARLARSIWALKNLSEIALKD